MGQQRPAQHYRSSPRAYQPTPTAWEYPAGSIVKRLNTQGCLEYNRHRYFVCEALANEPVRLWPFEDKYLIQYRTMFIRELEPKTGKTRTLLTEKKPKV